MIVIDRQPIPIYEIKCQECRSTIQYQKSEVSWCHITCPVCGMDNWANTTCPAFYQKEEET